jgi:hypothetical protein
MDRINRTPSAYNKYMEILESLKNNKTKNFVIHYSIVLIFVWFFFLSFNKSDCL